MPKDSEGSTGSSYIVDRKNRKLSIKLMKKKSYKVDWKKYNEDYEYREQTNYYFYQAKFFVKVKSIDKIDEGYIEITKDDGKKLKLTEIRVEEAIYHNVERKKWKIIF